MDVTMDMEVEHQITQPEQQLTTTETCNEETPMEVTCTTEEVQTMSQAQKQVNNNIREVIHSSQGIKMQGRRASKEIKLQ